MRPIHAIIAAVLLLTGRTPDVLAQAPAPTAADAFAAWHGCWRAEDDLAGTGSRLCVVPGNAGAARWITLVGAQRLREEARVADGVARPIVDDSCRGTESSRWSPEGHRLYHEAAVTCGTEPRRRLASVAYLVPGPGIIDVQTVSDGATTNVRVQRLRRATSHTLPDGTVIPRPSAAVEAASLSRPWTVADVIDAAAHLPADGVQAAIVEGPTAFSLTKATLVAMADAHVAEPVIDLMVATTYPKHFVVQTAGGRGYSAGSMAGAGWADPFYAPILGPASLYNCYGAYGWASSDYWRQCNPYGSGFYSGYPGYYRGFYGDSAYLYGPWYVSGPVGPLPSPSPHGEGRVVNGRGYTLVTPVDTSVPSQTAGGDRTSGQGTGTTNSGTSSGATTGGYSGGGGMSGGGGERTAVPRPPGA